MTASVVIENVSKWFGASQTLDSVSLTVGKGSFVTILGPSGSGKSTILRIVGGFEMPDPGRVLLDGKEITRLPPEARDVNTSLQGYALFPHMTVAENVAFGLETKRVPVAETTRRVGEALGLVRLASFGPRSIAGLSGGEQQRVALARAIVNRPKVLLLDEPLSALDLKLRRQMQVELKVLQRSLGITFIYVTHDQEEALSMSDRIVVMNKARVEQVGTPGEVYKRPKTAFVADFLGEANILAGRVRSDSHGSVEVEIGRHVVAATSDRALAPDAEVRLNLRPESITIGCVHGNNAFDARLVDAVFLGNAREIFVALDDLMLKAWIPAKTLAFPPEAGTALRIGWAADDMVVVT